MTTKNLLVELFVEELPPKALKKLGDAFADGLHAQLKAQGLCAADSVLTAFASPRRLAAHITRVAAQAPDKAVSQKLMPVAVGLDAAGLATPALLKKLQALGADVSDPAAAVAGLKRVMDGKAEALFYESNQTGATLTVALNNALTLTLGKLPIPKMMSYQLEQGCELPGWSSVSFVRPAHGLLALHGADVVSIEALGLKAGNSTQGHRFEAKVSPVVIAHADAYADTLREQGAVIASFAERRDEILKKLVFAATWLSHDRSSNYHVAESADLLDEVTALVEHPNVLVCEFEEDFLVVPQECLILTMKANQKYFPLLNDQGNLTNRFLVVSNISPADTSAVILGNERVIRPRLADAKFFFDQDRKKTLESRVEALARVVYHNKLGTQGERSERVRQIARTLGQQFGDDLLSKQADTAARLAKTDLLTDMVGEFPELQGIMGGYYARNDGLAEDVAIAIEDHYKPRFAGDSIPRNQVGAIVALADKMETLVGMFGVGNLPTGDKDPFALRRHALGVIRILQETEMPVDLVDLIDLVKDVFQNSINDPSKLLLDFFYDRLRVYFQSTRGVPNSTKEYLCYTSIEIEAVLALSPRNLNDMEARLSAVWVFSSLPEAPALAAANKRVGNILKKVDGVVQATVNPALLTEPAEIALQNAIDSIADKHAATLASGNYAENLQLLASLKAPVDNFFEHVMVNAEDPQIRANRLGLLATLHQAMNRVADLSKLAA